MQYLHIISRCSVSEAWTEIWVILFLAKEMWLSCWGERYLHFIHSVWFKEKHVLITMIAWKYGRIYRKNLYLTYVCITKFQHLLRFQLFYVLRIRLRRILGWNCVVSNTVSGLYSILQLNLIFNANYIIITS